MGYIGTKVFNKCKEIGWQVKGIDLKDDKNILDINCYNNIINFKPEIIFHLAAKPRIQFSIEHPSDSLLNNVTGTSRVLEFAKNNGVRRVIFSSSSSIYGNNGSPISPYALHKLMSEMECKFYAEHFGVDTVSLRYFNVYSEDQQVTDAYPTVIAAWMQNIRENKNLLVYGSGKHTRDYIHVDDVVSANIFAATQIDNFNGEYFDVGRGENYSLNYIKEYIISKHNTVFEHLKEKKSDPIYTLANIDKLNKLGWKAKINFEDGVKKCF
jgi:UDP-glucose 4-epimerase